MYPMALGFSESSRASANKSIDLVVAGIIQVTLQWVVRIHKQEGMGVVLLSSKNWSALPRGSQGKGGSKGSKCKLSLTGCAKDEGPSAIYIL